MSQLKTLGKNDNHSQLGVTYRISKISFKNQGPPPPTYDRRLYTAYDCNS